MCIYFKKKEEYSQKKEIWFLYYISNMQVCQIGHGEKTYLWEFGSWISI